MSHHAVAMWSRPSLTIEPHSGSGGTAPKASATSATAIAKLRLGRVYRAIQGVTGAVLVALGVRLAATPD